MEKIQIVTTGKQQEFFQEILVPASRQPGYPEASKRLAIDFEGSFKRHLKHLPAGERVTVCVTTFRELHQLNGLSFQVDDERKGQTSWNLSAPNFLAKRLGLEPLGHELGLEVFGQGLHYTVVPQTEDGFVICTINCNNKPVFWDDDQKLLLSDSYHARAIRLQQKKRGLAQLYSTSHVARSSDRFLLLYKEKVSH